MVQNNRNFHEIAQKDNNMSKVALKWMKMAKYFAKFTWSKNIFENWLKVTKTRQKLIQNWL